MVACTSRAVKRLPSVGVDAGEQSAVRRVMIMFADFSAAAVKTGLCLGGIGDTLSAQLDKFCR